jgi:hypothetical protein
MNERIKELLVEAGVINNNFNPLAYEQWYLDSLEKFAELIVKECCDVLYDNELGGYQTNYVLKEHFGVEQ